MSKTLSRGLQVLELLAEADEGIGLTELARAARMDKATVYRMVETLAARGYVAKQEPSSRYELTIKLWQLGHRVLARRQLSRVARPFLERMVEESGETAHLAIVDGTDAVYIDKVDGPAAVRIFTPLGGRVPLHCSSTGKALLAFRPEVLMEAIAKKLKPITRYTVTSKARLRSELQQVARRGFAVNQNEFRMGISGVAAPLRDSTGEVVASLGVLGPSERLPLAKLERFGRSLVEVAAKASIELGFRGGS